MSRFRHRQRIDHPRHRNVEAPAIAQFGIQKAEIEHRIMRNQRAVTQKIEQVFDRVLEIGFVRQESIAEAMHLFGNAGHCHARIEISVIAIACLDAIDEFDAPDLDDPVALFRVEAGGFGIKDNFTH